MTRLIELTQESTSGKGIGSDFFPGHFTTRYVFPEFCFFYYVIFIYNHYISNFKVVLQVLMLLRCCPCLFR